MAKFIWFNNGKYREPGFECPGCGRWHIVYVSEANSLGARWGWNQCMDKPTVTPSIMVKWNEGEERKKMICHSYVTDGQIRFLNDCTHELTGKTVDLPEIVDD